VPLGTLALGPTPGNISADDYNVTPRGTMFAPFAPADPSCDADFVPTCEQAKGFGFCDGVSAVCGELCVAEVQAICPQTCKLSHDDTAGHTLWDDNAAPTDYDTRLPPDIAQTICNVCSQGTDLPCCHNHPHDDGRRRLQLTTDASCSDAIWSPESDGHQEVVAYQHELIENLEKMSTPDSWWTAAHIYIHWAAYTDYDNVLVFNYRATGYYDSRSSRLHKGVVDMRRPSTTSSSTYLHNQQFYFETTTPESAEFFKSEGSRSTSEFFKIKVKSEGSVKCLEWSNPANPSDGRLYLLDCNGEHNQLWSFTEWSWGVGYGFAQGQVQPRALPRIFSNLLALHPSTGCRIPSTT